MIAFLRDVSPHLNRCELGYLARSHINFVRARRQHESYAEVLRGLGLHVQFAPALPEQPDGVFIQDIAVLLPEITLLSRPGAPFRLPEVESVGEILAQYRPIQRMVAPAALIGGDVLPIGRTLFVGLSNRTNAEGIEVLADAVDQFDYEVCTVEVRGYKHLKVGCTFIPPHFLVANPAWVDVRLFGDLSIIPVDESEPYAANTLTIAGTTLVSASFPRTEKRLQDAGIITRRVEMSEFEKAEAGLTCLSLILESHPTKTHASEGDLKLIELTGVPSSRGHGSQAVVYGGLIYVSPQLPFDAAAGPKGDLSIEEQTERVLHNISLILRAADSSLSRVLRATVYVADPNDVVRMSAVLQRVFGAHRPIWTVVTNGALEAGTLVQIEVVAAVATASPVMS